MVVLVVLENAKEIMHFLLTRLLNNTTNNLINTFIPNRTCDWYELFSRTKKGVRQFFGGAGSTLENAKEIMHFLLTRLLNNTTNNLILILSFMNFF